MFCAVSAKSPQQLWLTLCNPMDYSLPGFSVSGIFQARVLEWVAIFFFRRSSQPPECRRSNPHLLSFLHWHWQSGSFTTSATWEAQKWSRLEESISQRVCRDSVFPSFCLWRGLCSDLLCIFLTPLQRCTCNCTMTEEDRTFFCLGFGLALWAASFH